jgi:hypothetical protein
MLLVDWTSVGPCDVYLLRSCRALSLSLPPHLSSAGHRDPESPGGCSSNPMSHVPHNPGLGAQWLGTLTAVTGFPPGCPPYARHSSEQVSASLAVKWEPQ